jgi:hypothetical protein
MKIKLLNETHNQITFELTDINTSADKDNELLVINFDKDPVKNYRKKLIADTLSMYANNNRHTDWREIDRLIEKLMNIKIHWIS